MSENKTIVENLISEIETTAAAHDLHLYRYQTNGNNHSTTITYVLHDSGEKPPTAKHCTRHNDSIVLGKREGSTKRCEAYRKLSKMLEFAKTL